MAAILIVEDEPDLASVLVYNLERCGHRVTHVGDGKAALELLARERFDLLTLDLMLPDISGLEVCRELRRRPETRGLSVLMLTAKGDEIDRVVGFEVGADDYVTKPFSVREVLLRVEAILRRRGTVEEESKVLREGALRLDAEGHRVWAGERELQLTALELRLLHTLMARKGRVQSRDRLLDDVWGISAEVTTRTVDTHVKRLREKLGPLGDSIETVRGVGYRFRLSQSEPTD